MPLDDNFSSYIILNKNQISDHMDKFMKTLFPICRSITGKGVKQTLELINELIPLEIKHTPTGTKVFDWIIPEEWNINDAYVKNSKGEKIIDFSKSNLHLVSYSIPIKTKLSLNELKEHLFTIKEQPDVIPYVTSYYDKNWGFCLPYNQYIQLIDDGLYEVFIDSEFSNGNLIYGEFLIPGRLKEEVLLTCYVCHPSMCNDNLSGIVLLTFLASHLKKFPLKYSYRFLFIPETIGSITWISKNEQNLSNIKFGLVSTCLADSGNMTYKKTRSGDNEIDKITEYVLSSQAKDFKIMDFSPLGSDERQFCSPGIDLPIGSLMRTPYLSFPEYHTSNDNLDFIKIENLFDSLLNYLEVIFIIENNEIFKNLNPKCEPNLGIRGLYPSFGAGNKKPELIKAFSWVLNFSDGEHSLLDIAIKSKIDFKLIKKASEILLEKNLLILD